LCQDQGFGDVGASFASDSSSRTGEHDEMKLGGMSFDSCGLCHVGCAPLDLTGLAGTQFPSTHVLSPILAAACIETDLTLPERPPQRHLA